MFGMKRAIVILIAAVLSGCLPAALPINAYQPLLLEPSSLKAPQQDALRARFMGTTTILLDDGETPILIDGFFSRPSGATVLAGTLVPNPVRIDAALERAQTEEIAAIFVAHSHYDHAMDSADVAWKTGATLYGSESTRRIAKARGFTLRFETIAGGSAYRVGKFTVTVFHAEHSRPNLVPGKIDAPFPAAPRAADFKEGESFSFLVEHAGRRILIHPSANYIPGMFRGASADIVFLGIANLSSEESSAPGFMQRYWDEVVGATGAKLVIPVHWDDFTRGLDEPLQPLSPFFGSFDAAMALVCRQAREKGVSVRLMPLFDPVDVAPPDQPLTPRKAGGACPLATG